MSHVSILFSFNKVLLQKEELEQKHIHLLQVDIYILDFRDKIQTLNLDLGLILGLWKFGIRLADFDSKVMAHNLIRLLRVRRQLSGNTLNTARSSPWKYRS